MAVVLHGMTDDAQFLLSSESLFFAFELSSKS